MTTAAIALGNELVAAITADFGEPRHRTSLCFADVREWGRDGRLAGCVAVTATDVVQLTTLRPDGSSCYVDVVSDVVPATREEDVVTLSEAIAMARDVLSAA